MEVFHDELSLVLHVLPSQNYLVTCKQCPHNIREVIGKRGMRKSLLFCTRKHTSLACLAILSEFPVILKSRGIGIFSTKPYTANATYISLKFSVAGLK